METNNISKLSIDGEITSKMAQQLNVVEGNNSTNNKLIITGSFKPTCSIKIVFSGSNATVKLGSDCNFTGAIRIDSDAKVIIGNNFNSTNNISILCRAGKKVQIGDNCLFASSITIRTSDEHSVLSLKTGELLNPNKNVLIGSSVWICDNVIVLKGSVIGDFSIIGAGAVVSGSIKNNCVAAGNPVRIVKEDVFWTHDKPS